MQLTSQQKDIVGFPHSMCIDAVAGSGKTSTLINYAGGRSPGDRILYLAFNRTVRVEAQRKFKEAGLGQVDVHTAHSLAFRYIMGKGGYTLARSGEHSPADLMDFLRLKSRFSSSVAPVLAAHCKRFLSYFSNSTATQLTDLRYADIIPATDRKAQKFVQKFESEIYHYTGQVWQGMVNRTLGVSHDFYLKQFGLLAPALPYEVILFDEGQDASPVMLAVFLAQKAVKVIVGDAHQQIYGFRFAVNSLDQVAGQSSFTRFPLTQSFRFPSAIADNARAVLAWKKLIVPDFVIPPVEGLAHPRTVATPLHATIGRTNCSVLASAIVSLCVQQEIGSLYFEGNFETYTYMDSGGSVFDILNLFLGRRHAIRNPLLAGMYSTDELKEYIDLTGDKSMRVALEVVETYQQELPGYIDQIRAAHMAEGKRRHADRIFSTVHRCKGLEYDQIQLEVDFVGLDAVLLQLERIAQIPGNSQQQLLRSQLAEEINMLYVAITRTKNEVRVPQSMYMDLRRAKNLMETLEPAESCSHHPTGAV